MKRQASSTNLLPDFAHDIVSLLPGDYAVLRDLVIGVAEIAPSAASLCLEMYGNKDNRNLVRANLERITASMREHAFRLNGETIIFGQSQTESRLLLLDGHHRMEGCVQSNESFQSVIVIGIDTVAVTSLDAGTARTDAHRLTMEGRKNGDILNGAIHLLASWCRSQSFTRSATLSYHSKINYWLKGNPNLEQSADFARSHKAALGYYRSPMCVAFLHYITTAAHPGLSEVFWDALVHKQTPLRPGASAISLLIDRLVNENGSRVAGLGRRVIDLEKRCMYTLVAWNAFARGEDISKIQYPKGGQMPRVFGLSYSGNHPVLHGFCYHPDHDL